ncbi:transmembrane protein, putative [Medicago truncatula]|uniref:Transmembrane protein, putative n=1 Tax=Medicago truncatula TaxID=3880 RepID=G7IWD3_MEDTR|nr:transmembrane protein, putative [Medicago truncatula]
MVVFGFVLVVAIGLGLKVGKLTVFFYVMVSFGFGDDDEELVGCFCRFVFLLLSACGDLKFGSIPVATGVERSVGISHCLVDSNAAIRS